MINQSLPRLAIFRGISTGNNVREEWNIFFQISKKDRVLASIYLVLASIVGYTGYNVSYAIIAHLELKGMFYKLYRFIAVVLHWAMMLASK